MVRRWMAILLVALVLSACGGGSTAQTSTSGANTAGGDTGASRSPAQPSAPTMAAAAAAGGQEVPASEAGGEASAPSQQSAALIGRMVIRTATLTLLVKQADSAERQARAHVQNLGGYVLTSETSGDEQSRSVRLTFKVPVARFDEALNALEDLAIKVQTRSVSGQDVTDEFVDTESRLRNLRATEERLLQFLKEAKTVEEALLVNQQLTELQGQIEQASGRIKFLQESVAFSTITVDLNPEVAIALSPEEGWTPRTTAVSAWRGLLSFAQGLADVAIALTIWIPVWGTLLLAGLFVWRRLGRRGPPSLPHTQP